MHSNYPLHRFLTVCQEELTATVIGMPYSSCTPLLRAFHETAPAEKFGDVCVQQLFQVTDRIAVRTGISFTYLRDGRHLTGVAKVHGTVVVIDPYLSHLEPIVFLDKSDEEEITVRVPAAPFTEDQNGELRVGFVEATWLPVKDQLHIAQIKWSASERTYRVSREFSLSSSNSVDRALTGFDYRPFLFHPEQTSLSVRYIDPDSLAYLEARLPLEDGGKIEYRINSSPLTRDLESWFWSIINRYGHADRLEIENYIRRAESCYWENKQEWELDSYE